MKSFIDCSELSDWVAWVTQEGVDPLQKNFEPCSRCCSNFFRGGPNTSGYATVGYFIFVSLAASIILLQILLGQGRKQQFF